MKYIILAALTLYGGIVVVAACAQGPMPPRDEPRPAPRPPAVKTDATIRQIFAPTPKAEVAVDPVPPQPEPAPPAPQPPPMPAPVAPPQPTIPTDPKIVLDCPVVGQVGVIVVVKAGDSRNVRLMQIEIAPPCQSYYNATNHELVFSVREEGTFTITATATSPDGGLAKDTRTIQFGDPTAPVSSAKATLPQSVNYVQFVLTEARKMTHGTRKNDLLAMSGAFSSAYGLASTGGIRDRDELFRATDTLIEKALGPDLESCTPFITALLKQAGAEPADMGRLSDVWQQVAEGCRRGSQ